MSIPGDTRDADSTFAVSRVTLTAPRLGVLTITCGDEATVFVDGERDVCTAPALRRELARDAVRRARQVVVDLDRVDFVDLSGFAPIVSLAFAERPGVSISITAGSAPVQTLLGLTGLTDHFDVVQTGGNS